jgi:hypothetical protein
MTRYVGVDLHRRRSVIVVLDGDGTELWTHRIDNSPLNLGLEIEKAGPEPEVVLEATWGWYRAADLITNAGGRVHLAHPLGIAGPATLAGRGSRPSNGRTIRSPACSDGGSGPPITSRSRLRLIGGSPFSTAGSRR